MNRRRFVACFSSVGLGSTLMPGALAAIAQDATTITPEMMEVVGGVKSILFGDEASRVQIAGPPPGSIEQAYRSPLEN